MKKLFALLLAILMLSSVVLCGCGTTNSETTTESNNETTTFTVGFDAEFPPYGYKDAETGEYTGFDLELAQAVCDKLGWELVKQPIAWDSKDMELNSETIDCIWNGFTINGREDEYTWSKAYVDNSQVVLVSAESEIDSLDDLAGKVVAVQSDSSALASLTGDGATDANKQLCASFAELQEIADYNTALLNLQAGAVDAVCLDIGVAKTHMNNNEGKYVMLEEAIATEQYGIGFKLGNEELRDTVEAALMELVDDGTYAALAEKYELTDSICLGND